MPDYHGEMIVDSNNSVTQFRYCFMESAKATEDFIKRMWPNAVILWMEEGFIPENTERWGEWSMREPDEFTDLKIIRDPE